MNEMPPEPIDPFVNQDMLPVAKSAHELFVAFMAAGFTEGQAIQIVTGVITNLLMSAPQQGQQLCDNIGLSASGTTQVRTLTDWAHGAWCWRQNSIKFPAFRLDNCPNL